MTCCSCSSNARRRRGFLLRPSPPLLLVVQIVFIAFFPLSTCQNDADDEGKKYAIRFFDGTHARVAHRSEHMSWTRLSQDLWEPDSMRILKNAVDRRTLYLDIGAHVGLTASYVQGRAGLIVAYEPDATAFGQLRENLVVGEPVLINKCVAPSESSEQSPKGRLEITTDGGLVMSADCVSFSSVLQDAIIRSTLDELGRLFIKIDIEGGERQLLPAIRSSLSGETVKEAFPLGIVVYVEIHNGDPPTPRAMESGSEDALALGQSMEFCDRIYISTDFDTNLRDRIVRKGDLCRLRCRYFCVLDGDESFELQALSADVREVSNRLTRATETISDGRAAALLLSFTDKAGTIDPQLRELARLVHVCSDRENNCEHTLVISLLKNLISAAHMIVNAAVVGDRATMASAFLVEASQVLINSFPGAAEESIKFLKTVDPTLVEPKQEASKQGEKPKINPYQTLLDAVDKQKGTTSDRISIDDPEIETKRGRLDVPSVQTPKIVRSGSTAINEDGHPIPPCRSSYPERNPHVCLAFLSCCDRTHLLERTMAGAVRHMEVDEPTWLRYEIAWVDNGSDPVNTARVLRNFEIEHASALPDNHGMAWGINALYFELCTAPYVLILEEDWLYLDRSVSEQTLGRRHAVARALTIASSGLKSYDGRDVYGAVLRPETYDFFLEAGTDAGPWKSLTHPAFPDPEAHSSDDAPSIDYRIYCADRTLSNGSVWGSYTNGAGLYKISSLRSLGRMYGEPDDVFNGHYSESNYAFRAGRVYCLALVRAEDGCDTATKCNAAFQHIGAGQGARPNKKRDIAHLDEGWMFYGTEVYGAFRQLSEKHATASSGGAVAEAEVYVTGGGEAPLSFQAQREEIERHQRLTAERNRHVFKAELEKRREMREQAAIIRKFDPDEIRKSVAHMAHMTDEEMTDLADRLESMADSYHPLPGFWDDYGNPI